MNNKEACECIKNIYTVKNALQKFSSDQGNPDFFCELTMLLDKTGDILSETQKDGYSS
jgi:hypothetical protein